MGHLKLYKSTKLAGMHLKFEQLSSHANKYKDMFAKLKHFSESLSKRVRLLFNVSLLS